MKLLKKLVGDHCYLSPIDSSESELVASWSNDIRVALKTGDMSDMITLEMQKSYLEGMTNRSGYGFYIVDINTDNVIGVARIMRVNHIHRNAVVGIFIGETKNRSRGIGTESLNLLLDFAFNIINLRNVMAEVFSFNKASITICKKVGFNEIGRRRSAIIYGKHEFDEIFMDILSDEFESIFIEKELKKDSFAKKI